MLKCKWSTLFNFSLVLKKNIVTGELYQNIYLSFISFHVAKQYYDFIHQKHTIFVSYSF